MSGYGRDPALICENGHVLNEYAFYRQTLNRGYCETCGAKAIAKCPACERPIPGGYTYTDDYGTFPTDTFRFARDSYCTECGAPYPWTVAALEASRELADELDDLTADERERLKTSFEDITRDSPRTELAATRIKKIVARIGGEGGQTIARIAETLAVEAAKRVLFGGGA